MGKHMQLPIQCLHIVAFSPVFANVHFQAGTLLFVIVRSWGCALVQLPSGRNHVSSYMGVFRGLRVSGCLAFYAHADLFHDRVMILLCLLHPFLHCPDSLAILAVHAFLHKKCSCLIMQSGEVYLRDSEVFIVLDLFYV